MMFVVSRPPSQRRSCSIQQQQNPDTPIAIHRSLADSQHACADALIVRTYVDPAAHSSLRTVGGARSGSSRRILSAQICTTVQPYRIRVSVSAVRCPTIRSVDPRSPTRSPAPSGRVRRSISTDFTTLPPTRRLSSSLPVKVVAIRPLDGRVKSVPAA